jgi:uridine kinase
MKDFQMIISEVKKLLSEKERVILAIDGRCASGKTTFAKKLLENFDCNVIHMDDFFLQSHQRTPERLAEVGGNLDRERFSQEVIGPLLQGTEFFYRPFDCSEETLAPAVFVPKKKLVVVEGTYSLHPFFGTYFDLAVFLTVSPGEQKERILCRPNHLHASFFEKWIPMEEAYFTRFKVRERCDFVLNTGEEKKDR